MASTNALDMLRNDHQKVKQLLGQLLATAKGADKRRTELLDKIKKEVFVHTTLEEELLYPVLRAKQGPGGSKLFFEAKEEHRAVEKLVLPDLENTNPTSDEFRGRAKVLTELVEHHADEEEEAVFTTIAQALSAAELEQLGAQIEQRKLELLKQL